MTDARHELLLVTTADRLAAAIEPFTHYVADEPNPDRKRQAAAVLTALKAAQASLRELWLAYDDVPY